MAHILSILQRLIFLHKLGLNILQIKPAQTPRFSWLYNMLHILKTYIYSLWKDKYNLLYKMLYNKLELGTEHII